MTKLAPENLDPTLATSVVKIGGKEYRMCFNLGALAQAESELIAQGHDVNLLSALPSLNLNSTLVLFAASIRKFHPEISFEEAKALLTLPQLLEVGSVIADVWNKSLAPASDEDKANPTQAAD
jgi:hypothetical protein